MASLIDPLNSQVPIVNPDGTPTPLLNRLLQKLQIKPGSAITSIGGKLDVSVPTRSTGDNSTNIATTAFVENVLGTVIVNTTGGTTVLTQDQAGATAILIRGTLTSNALLQFGSGSSAYFGRLYDVRNQTSGSFTVSLQACVTGPTNTYIIAPGGSQLLYISGTAVANAMTPFQPGTATIQPGLVPVSPGGTSTFLRADGTWAAPSGGGGGLFGNVLSPTPTAAITGLTNLIGTGAATADTAAGQMISGTGATVAYTSSVPATPYSITALIAVNNNGIPLIGWTDLTKYQFMYPNPGSSFAAYGQINVQNNSARNTFASTAVLGGNNYPLRLIWYKIRDDGTTIYWYVSIDGVNYSLQYSVAKASGYLGSSGYSHIIVGPNGGAGGFSDNVIMSWTQGT